MNSDDFEKLRTLMDDVIFAGSKKDAQGPIRKLEFFASGCKGRLDGYNSGLLRKIVSHSKEGAGQGEDKQHWASSANENFSYLKSQVELKQEGNK